MASCCGVIWHQMTGLVGEDFCQIGPVSEYIKQFFPTEAQSALIGGGFKVGYTDYDWPLNDAGARR
jgi:hypothetical protein